MPRPRGAPGAQVDVVPVWGTARSMFELSQAVVAALQVLTANTTAFGDMCPPQRQDVWLYT